MDDLKRVKITGTAIAVQGSDIDTDRIIPARYLKCVVFDGLGQYAFEDDRLQNTAKGITHPFDDPRYADAEVLFVNKNFGCGSSREHAPQAIMRWGKGIKAIVGESFAEIFFGNCIALGIPCLVVSETDAKVLMDAVADDPQAPVTVDLVRQEVRILGRGGRDGVTVSATIPDGPRQQFLEGKWDSTAELLSARDQIAATAAGLPYFNGWK